MNPSNERALEEELGQLEVELHRVAALSTTSERDRAELAAPLERLKKTVRVL
jgi:hypothetical protein